MRVNAYSLPGIFVAIVLALTAVVAQANEADQLSDAQRCLDEHVGSRDVLHCIDGISTHTSRQANRIKCAARVINQGFDWQKFAWVYVEGPDSSWVRVVNGLSDTDIKVSYAKLMRWECGNSGSKALSVLGEYYVLRALLLQIAAPIVTAQIRARIGSLRDDELRGNLALSVTRIRDLCRDGMRPGISLCHEALQLDDYPGETMFEKLVKSFQHD